MIIARSIVAFALFALAACAAAAAPPAPAGGKFSDEKIQHDGRERRFLVHDFASGGPAPVVIVLHGGGGHPENAVDMSQMDAVAAREHFIAVYPGGTGGMPGGRLLTWNATHCCAYARENAVDDVGFIRTVIDQLVASGRADLCVLARPHLADPFWTLRAAAAQGWDAQRWPVQYAAGRSTLARG